MTRVRKSPTITLRCNHKQILTKRMNYKETPIYFVDIETTGPSSQSDRVIELAVLKTVGLKEVDRFHTLINPQRTIPYFIQNFTGIKPNMVSQKPGFSEIAKDLNDFLEPGLFVAHNVNFDYNFLKKSLKREGFELDMPKLCTVRLSRKLFPEHRKHNLDSVAARMNLQIENRHRALDDCQVLVDFLNKLHEQMCNETLALEIKKLIN